MSPTDPPPASSADRPADEATNRPHPASASEGSRRVLVCGATGYIGGRLVPRLLASGYQVRCLVRSPQKLAEYPWRDNPRLEVMTGDLQDIDSVRRAAAGMDVAYYLVHSMAAAGQEYASRDVQLATNFRDSIAAAGVKRCVYLGGLGELGPELSEHLRSRREVESLLVEGEVPVTSFRAAMIIGSGSASFEILRYLVDRLPVMVTPRWVQTETQPIAVRDVLRYLVECLDVPETAGTTLDIGGRGIVTYLEMMRLMAQKIGLPKRWIIPVPVLTPKLSSLWIGLVTPVNSRIARPLSEGLRNRTVCRDQRAEALMPGKLLSVEEAIDAALGKWEEGVVETRWSTAGEMPGDPAWSGGTVFQDQRELLVHASASDAFAAACRIGGNHGYWGADWLWQLRGWMDKLVGGPGLRRGRRHPRELAYGEAVDFWRVSQYEKNRQLGLRAEMKLPGTAELQFTIEPLGEQESKVTQTAKFRPRGLLGILYWYAVVPLHYFVFQFMLQGIKRAAEETRSSRR